MRAWGKRFYDGLEKFSYLIWFRNVGTSPLLAELVGSPLHGVCADHDDGDMAGGRIGFELVEDLIAPHVGEIEVEEDQIGAMFFCGLDAIGTQSTTDQAILRIGLENALDESLVQRLIFDIENGDAR
jgi:hypothetical protein